MKKLAIIAGLSCLLLSSCVTLGKYEDLDARYREATKDKNLAKRELKEIKDENAELQRQNQALTVEVQELTAAKNDCETRAANLKKQLESARHNYDTTMENYMQQLSGTSRDLAKARKELNARTQELNEKEAAFNAREQELLAKQQALEEKEAAARAALAAKEKEVENIRNAVTNALLGFADKGIAVETKDGKVYVSMESKLLFASGSWQVSQEGVTAVKELAKVLEANPDLDILVEGHTDNDAYNGRTDIKDNWDLSVMRATAITKLLLQYGSKIDPARIEACGHGEFAPKVANNSAANKAQNRRTEIILTPKLSDVLNIVR
ncbi:MAG: OmpA family protein [Bacteroidales bacterium]|nr:OmpA family protein [Bacteroidales bacterium]